MLGRHPAGTHLDTAVGHRHQVGVERDTGGSELADDATPVGIAPVERALHQLALGDPAGRPGGVVGRRRPDDAHGRHLGGPFGVFGHLGGQAGARLGEGVAELGTRRCRTPPAGEDHHGVVGRGRPIDGEVVERVRHGDPQGRTQVGRTDRGIGGEHGQHGGHVGSEHGRPLGHPPDGETRSPHHDLLGHGIRGEDCRRRRLSRLRVGASRFAERCNPGGDGVDGERDPDEPGRAHQHLFGRAAERLGHEGTRALGMLAPGGAGGGVGVAAVEHHRRSPSSRGGQMGT